MSHARCEMSMPARAPAAPVRASGACENRLVARYDAVVAGAGPAGSTTAFRLAAAGARTLLLDRARFPRDKPCAGGVSIRALRDLPCGMEPVVEEVVHGVDVRIGRRGKLARRSEQPLVLLT